MTTKSIAIPTHEITCPDCGAKETHKEGGQQIRVHQAHQKGYGWFSQCLVCSGGYDRPNGTFSLDTHNSKLGWFI
jgi:hypothetical protein